MTGIGDNPIDRKQPTYGMPNSSGLHSRSPEQTSPTSSESVLPKWLHARPEETKDALHSRLQDLGISFTRELGYSITKYKNAFVALVQKNPSDEQLAIYEQGLAACKQHGFYPDDYTNDFVALVQVENTLPSVNIALRNFKKALSKNLYSNQGEFTKAVNDLSTLAFEELNRRGLINERDTVLPTISHSIANYPAGSPIHFPHQIGEVYDFGLDIFHGFEALTQAARPIRGIEKPLVSLLERNLRHLAHSESDSYRLNCSKEKHLDLEFPGIAWHFDNLRVPEIQKQILESIPSGYLDTVGIASNNFDDLEATEISIMRGGVIMSNSSVTLQDSAGQVQDYSPIFYNDHFDNPTNTVILMVPSKKIKDKINASKVELRNYSGHDVSKSDILTAGLDAHSLMKDPDVYNLCTADTLRGGFGNCNNSHQDVYQAVMAYKSIWRKLQLVLSLLDRGFQDHNKHLTNGTFNIRPELAPNFNQTDFMLNEVYNWREWYLNSDSKAGTPVLIDADPFRISDERNWTIKLDPAGTDGVELSIRDMETGDVTVQTLPDPPADDTLREDWSAAIKTTWGSEVYSRIHDELLTKALRFYNRNQIV